MTKRVVVEGEANRTKWCEELEAGNILFFPKTPFDFPQDQINFLLKQRQGGSKARKNIAYKPQADKITNHDAGDPLAAERLKEILRNYSQSASAFLGKVLEPYAKAWKLDYASFRPFQEKGRKLRVRARNDLLHVDAFPTRPLHGARILRFFTNINPTEGRHWITAQPFAELAKMFGGEGGVKFPEAGGWEMKAKEWLKAMGVKVALRSPYDTFMLKMHHFLKENGEFQKNCPKDSWVFPPGCCWAVFTDQVSHAALAGQYALEQTFLVPASAMVHPDKAPVKVLERLAGRPMVEEKYLYRS